MKTKRIVLRIFENLWTQRKQKLWKILFFNEGFLQNKFLTNFEGFLAKFRFSSFSTFWKFCTYVNGTSQISVSPVCFVSSSLQICGEKLVVGGTGKQNKGNSDGVFLAQQTRSTLLLTPAHNQLISRPITITRKTSQKLRMLPSTSVLESQVWLSVCPVWPVCGFPL